MPRSHIKLDELHALAVQINKMRGLPLQPWTDDETRVAAVGCHYVEALNDYVSLLQITDAHGGTREVLPPMHRGALLRQMQVLMQGMQMPSENTMSRELEVLRGSLPKFEGDVCRAVLRIADDFHDSTATIRCQRPKGHEGPHLERFAHYGAPVAVLFERDDRDFD